MSFEKYKNLVFSSVLEINNEIGPATVEQILQYIETAHPSHKSELVYNNPKNLGSALFDFQNMGKFSCRDGRWYFRKYKNKFFPSSFAAKAPVNLLKEDFNRVAKKASMLPVHDYKKGTSICQSDEVKIKAFDLESKNEVDSSIVVYYDKNGTRYVKSEDLKKHYRVGKMPILKFLDKWGGQESIYYAFGYSVAKDRALNDGYRMAILCHVVGNQYSTKAHCLNYLNYLIKQYEKNPSYLDAVRKWRQDLFGIKQRSF